jgi:hypothetical protein
MEVYEKITMALCFSLFVSLYNSIFSTDENHEDFSYVADIWTKKLQNMNQDDQIPVQ